MKELPKQTVHIFETLNKGRFVNANSNDPVQRELYTVIENNSEVLANYFEQIGFHLEAGDGYFYFSREEEKAGIESKIRYAFKWIDILDFFTTFHNGFAPGLSFYTTELQEQIRVNGLLRTKLQDMGTKAGEPAAEQIDAILKSLEREGFLEKIDDFDHSWKVTAAWQYLTEFVMAITLHDEEAEADQDVPAKSEK